VQERLEAPYRGWCRRRRWIPSDIGLPYKKNLSKSMSGCGTAFLTPPICYNSRGAISSILPPPADFAGFGAFAIYRLFIGTMIYADISYDDGQNVFCS
jgi:hypothetical protein